MTRRSNDSSDVPTSPDREYAVITKALISQYMVTPVQTELLNQDVSSGWFPVREGVAQ